MLDRASATFNETERMRIYGDIQRQAYEDIAWMPICTPLLVNASTSKLKGYSLVFISTQQVYNTCYFID